MKRHILLFSQTGSEVFNIIDYLETNIDSYTPCLIVTDNQPYEIDARLDAYIKSGKLKFTTRRHVKDVDFLRKVFGDPSTCIITLHGWLHIIPQAICNEYEIYNGHPGLITKYPELKGKDPQKRVWENKNKYELVGSVIHEVTPEVDNGRIVSVRELRNDFNSIDSLFYELHETSINMWREFLSTYFKNKKITLCFATKSKKNETILWKSLKDKKININVKCKEFNRDGLQKTYNDFLQECREDNTDVVLLVHDDVYINCYDLVRRVNDASNNFSVFGLAGCTTCTITKPVLWHIMSKRENQKGCVAHGTPDEYFYTSFGSMPSRALLLDGVFMGIDINKLPQHVKFDDSYPSKFHFYDLDFSLECNKNRVILGIVDIPIIHQSPGLTDPNQEFYQGQQYFIDKWKK